MKTRTITPSPEQPLRPSPAQTAFFAAFLIGIITLVATTIANSL